MSEIADDIYLLAGLGNPGRIYRHNRHNLGFMLVGYLAERLEIHFSRRECEALTAHYSQQAKQILLAKPQTMMNRSGLSVRSLIRAYRVPLSHVLVIFDDLDLPLGVLRIRERGGSGGHKGLQSVIDEVGSDELARLRIGIGRPPGGTDPVEYVLQDFSDQELEALGPSLAQAADCVDLFLTGGIEVAMNRCNPIRQEP